MDPMQGTVSVSNGTLNLRDYPSSSGKVIANLPNGATVTIYGEWNAGMWCTTGIRWGMLPRHTSIRENPPGFPPRREAGGPETGVHLTDLVKNSKSVRREFG